MKIDERTQASSASLARTPDTGSAQTLSDAKLNLASAGGGNDTVELSGPLRVLQTSATARANKVANLTASVRSGSYSVNSLKVSQSLLQETFAAVSR